MRALILSAALAVAAGAPALAQSGYGGGGSGQGGYGQGGYPSPSGYGPAPAQQAAPPPEPDLGRELGLRPDQRAAYRDYQAAFREGQEPEPDPAAETRRLTAMTTPQRLDDAARQMERERVAFERVAAATRRFYASLTDTQRRTFDRLTAPSDDEGGYGQGDDDGYGTPSHPPQVQPRR